MYVSLKGPRKISIQRAQSRSGRPFRIALESIFHYEKIRRPVSEEKVRPSNESRFIILYGKQNVTCSSFYNVPIIVHQCKVETHLILSSYFKWTLCCYLNPSLFASVRWQVPPFWHGFWMQELMGTLQSRPYLGKFKRNKVSKTRVIWIHGSCSLTRCVAPFSGGLWSSDPWHHLMWWSDIFITSVWIWAGQLFRPTGLVGILVWFQFQIIG